MTWTQSANIRGASGVPGASGASGLQGASGVPGASGPVGATGASGGTGGTGGPGTTTWADITDKPGAILNYKGTWNASTNTPSLTDSTGSGGDVYRVSVGGSRNLGSGTISWEVGDYAIWSPVTSSYEKADTTDAVSSVAGRTGDVTLTSADLGASGTPSASTFLRGDNTWATGPIGATGASGGTGATGGTGAAGSNYSRVIQTITAPTTLGASGSTDYVTLLSTGPGGDSAYSSVTALLHCDGSNNSTAALTDNSPLAATWSVNGAAKLSTAQFKFGTASVLFDGTTGTYSAPSAALSNFAMGTGDFCIEMQIRPTAVSGIKVFYDHRNGSDSVAGAPTLYLNGAVLTYIVGTAITITGSSLSANTWYHVAVTRASGTTRLYLNGSLQGSATADSVSYVAPAVTLGAAWDSAGRASGTYAFPGYIDEVRITKGTGAGRYTANFTAPTEAFPDSGSTLGIPTLPSATNNTGRYSFRNLSNSSITIGASGSQRINGATGGLSLAASATTELISDGATGWYSL